MKALLSQHPSRGGVLAPPKLERSLQDMGGSVTGSLCSPLCGATFAMVSGVGAMAGVT